MSTVSERGLYSQPAFSADRTRLAVVKTDPPTQNQDIWAIDLSTGTSSRITSDPAPEATPIWSPDGNQIAFVSTRGGSPGLYRRASSGAGDDELLYRHTGFGGLALLDWSTDGRFLNFLYGINISGAFYKLPLNGGGNATEVLRPDFNGFGARVSPDGRFVAFRSGRSGRSEIYVQPFDASPEATAAVRGAPWQVSTNGGIGMISWRQDGKELYYLAADRGVMAVDVTTTSGFRATKRHRLFRAPESIVDPVTPGPDALAGVSRDGQRFVFAIPPAAASRRLTLFDRQGNVVRTVGEAGPYYQPALSPDGRRVALIHNEVETGRQGIWTIDLSTGKHRSVTTDGAPASAPIWSPDGSQVAFVSSRGDSVGVYRKAWNGAGREQLLYRHTPGTGSLVLTDWSSDGRFLSFHAGDVVYVLPLNGGGHAIDAVRTEFSAVGGRLSPDSRFLAYLSNESGRYEVYVRPFDNRVAGVATTEAGRSQVSTDGAQGMISWRQDSKELYFLAVDGGVMAVAVETAFGVQAGRPRLLFSPPNFGGGGPYGIMANSAQLRNVSSDGERFVFAVQTPSSLHRR